ncbi:hypothetical protein ACU635_23740 [[Actinomadura] parvosata]|uniref:hypothetical protein n=1 Tax=[Actinomadura] parvosata TaxID=1955412 RepID=UPI00406CE173
MRALLISGHLVDRPGRTPPRFPQHRVPPVAAAIGRAMEEWDIGPRTLVICGGARGADLIGAELALRRRAAVRLCLALPPEEFARQSVDLPGTDWHTRFEEVRRRAEVRQLPEGAAKGDEVFARANAWMVEQARELDAQPRAIVVWNGERGDGPGGTDDLVARLGYSLDDPRLRVIHPATGPAGA